MERQEVLEAIAEQEIDFIRLQFTDILGVIKNVSIPASQIEKAFEEGIWFDGSSIEGFVRIQESDMRLDPDPDSFTVLPFEHDEENDITTARLICDVTHPNGEPFMGDPRYTLKRALDKSREMGYEFYAGPEPEFFVFDQEDGQPTLRPQDSGGYFDLGPKDQATELRGDIIQTLDGMGFEVEASHHEVAEGQHEIDFKYEDALTTADNISTFRMVVRAVAEMHDLHATFMPKPIAGINGSGMHTHMSLFDGDDPVFHDPDHEFQLSKMARQFMAGILDHAKAITAVTNPTVNSYKRIIPGYEAPTYIAWSDVNRSALIRKPASRTPEGSRFELRSPDPSCNPYLHLAVCLRAGLDGIERELECPDPVRENIYEFNEEKRNEYGIDVLPGNLNQAIEALQDDQVVLDALGPHISEKFIQAKKSEWSDYKAFVSEWEHDRYFETF